MNDATSNSCRKQAVVNICISATVAADHGRRGVFPTLRPNNALRTEYNGNKGSCLYAINKNLACDLVEDMKTQRRAGEQTAGMKNSYTALLKQITSGFRWRELKWRHLDNMPDDTDLALSHAHVSKLFASLGIPAATTGGRAQA